MTMELGSLGLLENLEERIRWTGFITSSGYGVVEDEIYYNASYIS